MQKNLKRIMAVLLCLVLTMGVSVSVFAATPEVTTTGITRDGGYYVNHYTNGNSYGTFKITANGPISQFTVQTQDFSSDSWIIVEVWNSSQTVQISQQYISITGNKKKNNIPLNGTYPAGTYTIKYNVNIGGPGWIGVWLY